MQHNSMTSRKQTAWKKSRKFGDVKGGRIRPKLANNIFNRAHNLQAPSHDDELPILLIDNPSRDFYFPINEKDVADTLAKLPEEHTKKLTHLWLRKQSKKELEHEGHMQGCFICGSGVNLIVLFPFPKHLKMLLGKKKPSNKLLNWYKPFNPELCKDDKGWYLQWTQETIKQYYLQGLLLHEIGHQVDSYYKAYWSKNYYTRAENFADNYAFYWGNKIRNEYQ